MTFLLNSNVTKPTGPLLHLLNIALFSAYFVILYHIGFYTIAMGGIIII